MNIDVNNFHFRKFDKDSKSSFPYWYYHWKAFNLVALSLGVWRPKFLLHDIEKPFLKLFWDYKKVHDFHQTHADHHIKYSGGVDKIDWVGMVVDNECSRYTKSSASLSAREWFDFCVANNKNKEVMEKYYKPTLEKLGL